MHDRVVDSLAADRVTLTHGRARLSDQIVFVLLRPARSSHVTRAYNCFLFEVNLKLYRRQGFILLLFSDKLFTRMKATIV